MSKRSLSTSDSKITKIVRQKKTHEDSKPFVMDFKTKCVGSKGFIPCDIRKTGFDFPTPKKKEEIKNFKEAFAEFKERIESQKELIKMNLQEIQKPACLVSEGQSVEDYYQKVYIPACVTLTKLLSFKAKIRGEPYIMRFSYYKKRRVSVDPITETTCENVMFILENKLAFECVPNGTPDYISSYKPEEALCFHSSNGSLTYDVFLSCVESWNTILSNPLY